MRTSITLALVMGNACVLPFAMAADALAPLALEPMAVIGTLPLPSFATPSDSVATPLQAFDAEDLAAASRWGWPTSSTARSPASTSTRSRTTRCSRTSITAASPPRRCSARRRACRCTSTGCA